MSTKTIKERVNDVYKALYEMLAQNEFQMPPLTLLLKKEESVENLIVAKYVHCDILTTAFLMGECIESDLIKYMLKAILSDFGMFTGFADQNIQNFVSLEIIKMWGASITGISVTPIVLSEFKIMSNDLDFFQYAGFLLPLYPLAISGLEFSTELKRCVLDEEKLSRAMCISLLKRDYFNVAILLRFVVGIYNNDPLGSLLSFVEIQNIVRWLSYSRFDNFFVHFNIELAKNELDNKVKYVL